MSTIIEGATLAAIDAITYAKAEEMGGLETSDYVDIKTTQFVQDAVSAITDVAIKASVQASADNIVESAIESASLPVSATNVSAVVSPATASLTLPDTQTQPQTQTAIAIGAELELPPTLEKGKIKPPIPTDDEEMTDDEKREAFRGAVTWKQGIVYHAWKYPYEDDERDLATFYKEPPPGAVIIPGAKTAQETIQLYLGDTPPPPDRIINMGIMDINISTTQDGQLQIRYAEDAKQARGDKDAWFEGKEKRGAHTSRKKKKAEVESVSATNNDDFWSGSV
jgi:hypothetical protein